ncbi:endonuclease [Actinoplanes hulinensis]|uniref:Endonuclease n=1 Tax=Actinoplanes hulinensis TaxID=1144547 RepID=A0ABS7B7A0_9ACTN|nr:endonuclease [Actinoplanes hulinensis]
MPAPTVHRRLVALLIPVLTGLLVASVTVLRAPSAAAAAPLTVAQAISSQSGTGTVVGYIVGEPTATDTVRFSSFIGDTALAIADSAAETSTSRMLYVQITSSYRSAFGLAGNPSNVGRALTVTGTLTAYFSHAGLKSPTAMTFGGTATTSPTATAGPTASSTTDTYYAAALGKSGSSLKSALHTIVSTGVTTISYDAVWNALKVTDQDPANSANVILLYSGISRSKTLNGGATGNWNREHVWPQSHGDFGTANGPGTDLHHLRPEDVTINALRGNKDFDTGGSAVSGATGNYTDADSWEPRAAIKGDVARMVFYMAVRYEGGDSWANLELNNSTANGSNPYLGKRSTLLAWHTQDPPTAAERTRNQVIYASYQHNRNPFIDHPEWAASIFG